MPSVKSADFKKIGILDRIREKLSIEDDKQQFVSPGIFRDKNPNDLVIDGNNNLMPNQVYNQNLMNEKFGKFENKTTGLNGKFGNNLPN